MTMPAPTQTIELPAPQYPMLTRMISHALFPEKDRHRVGCPHCNQTVEFDRSKQEESEPVTWVVSQPHPLIPDMKVIRMFVDRGGVEVYSISSDGRNGMRNLIPMSWVRLTEEAMPLDVFADELEAAETEDPNPDPDPEPPAPEATPSNGQVAS